MKLYDKDMISLLGIHSNAEGMLVERIGWLLEELRINPDIPVTDCVGHLFRAVEAVRQNLDNDDHRATLLAFEESMTTVRFYTHQYNTTVIEQERLALSRLLTVVELFLRSMAGNIERLVDWRRIDDWDLNQLQRNLGKTMERISRVTG